MARPGGAEHAHRHGRIRHHRGGLCHRVAQLAELDDFRILQLAEKIPDARVGGHHVRLVATVGDDIVRTLLQAQVLAAIVPADVHQLDGIERTAAAPWRHGGVGGFAAKRVFDRNQAGVRARAPGGLEIVADVGEKDDVDLLEQPRANEVRLGAQLLLGDAGPEHNRAGQVRLLHDPLHGERGGEIERLAGVVAFAVAGRAIDQGIMVGDAGFLRGLRDAVDVGAERDDRLARTSFCDPCRRDSRHAVFHPEALLLEDAREKL